MLLEEDWEQVKEPTPRITILEATQAIVTTDNREPKLNMQLLAILRPSVRMKLFRVQLLYGIVTDSYHYIGYRRVCYSR